MVSICRIIGKSATAASTIDFSVVPPDLMATFIVLMILGILVAIFISGYRFKVLKFSIAKSNELPDFRDFLQYFVMGIVSLAGSAILQFIESITVFIFPNTWATVILLLVLQALIFETYVSVVIYRVYGSIL